MEKKKRRFPLSLKLTAIILTIIILLSLGLTAIAYQVNSTRVDRDYKETASKMSSTVAKLLDADWVSLFLSTVRSVDFQKVREEAVATNDETVITKYLARRGMSDAYKRANDTMKIFRDRLGAKYIYLISVDSKQRTNLIDPEKDSFNIGSVTEPPKEIAGYRTNMRIEPTVMTTENGWICSAYEPVTTSYGKAVALVGVDMDMNEVMKERQQFLMQMLIFTLILMAISITAGIFFMRRIATKPLKMLSEATARFADNAGDYTEENIISLPIKSNDEIGDLYGEIRTMQGSIVEYLNNLTAVTAEKERIGAELNVATQIQADMLPSIFPPFPERSDFDIYATMTPAKEVGGDFYDFFLVDDDHLALVMADVSGKGVPAALFMVIAKTLIKNRAQMGDSPAQVLRSVNEQLCEGNEAELFVTVWLAIIELSTGKGLAANAGHEHPVLRRKDGSFELVEYRHSPVVAAMVGIRFKEHEFELHPGDTLFVYTDGVPEATNAENELFGTARMLEALNRNPSAEPDELLGSVKNAIDVFVGDAPQFDDITMLGLKYKGGEPQDENAITIDAETDRLPDVLAFVDSKLETMDCPPKTQMQIDVAVEELFVNIAQYAYAPEDKGTATIRVEREEDSNSVVITFIDRGIPYDPLKKEDPDITLSAEERRIGGLGIYMVKKSMDYIDYEYKGRQNILRIKKKL